MMRIFTFILYMLLPAMLSAQVRYTPDIDPLDTLDEVDLYARRDTSLLKRRNIARDTKVVNALDYVLDDRYVPPHHSFSSNWYDHIYVGGSFGMEQIKPQNDDFRFRTVSNAGLFIGKEFSRTNSLRLAVGGGWGYQRDLNHWLTRVQTRLDYIYNVSTSFLGYNPARRMEVSLLFGIGANCSWMRDTDKEFAPEGHFGMQFKCFTGPLGTVNIEPYVGLSSDRIDVSGPRNWRGYDIFYGLNVNYSVFLVDNLSKEARLRMLQSRLADERMIDPNTIEQWRTPWFVEMSNGAVMSTSNYLSIANTLGHQTALSVGRWLSPVMGFRLSAVSRSTKWREEDVPLGGSASFVRSYNSHYFSGRVEALFNPLGFMRTFRWDAPWGMYMAFGGEMGSLTKYNPDERLRTYSESYDLGAHFWTRLSRDLQLFVEPRYTHNVYTEYDSNADRRIMHGDNSWGVDIGLTMLIRSRRFHAPDKMDETQNFIYRSVRGLRAGIAGGLSLLQRKEGYDAGSSLNWNGMAVVEYRFSHLHTLRLHADLLNLSGSLYAPSAPTGASLWETDTRLLVTALNYQVSLTNLCSGRINNRRFELEAYAGPVIAFTTKESLSPVTGTAASAPEAIDSKKSRMGFDIGLKLSTNVWKGLSVFMSPTVYMLGGTSLPGCSTAGMGGMSMYETLNLGVQYKIGHLRRNHERLRQRRMARDRDWRDRQLHKERERDERQKAKIEERHRQRQLQRQQVDSAK